MTIFFCCKAAAKRLLKRESSHLRSGTVIVGRMSQVRAGWADEPPWQRIWNYKTAYFKVLFWACSLQKYTNQGLWGGSDGEQQVLTGRALAPTCLQAAPGGWGSVGQSKAPAASSLGRRDPGGGRGKGSDPWTSTRLGPCSIPALAQALAPRRFSRSFCGTSEQKSESP